MTLNKVDQLIDSKVNSTGTHLYEVLSESDVKLSGKNLSKLSKSKFARNRSLCAEYGYKLEELINDSSYVVRASAVAKGMYPTKLKERSATVRYELAKGGKFLSELVKDSDYAVKTQAMSVLIKQNNKEKQS